jgi:hypothetical protein
MRHTLRAVFDDPGAAQHALNKLLAAGFTREDVAISLVAPAAGKGDTASEGARDPAVLVRHLFAHFAGTRSSGRRVNHADLPEGGCHVLTLTAESEMEADRATALVGRFLVSGVDPAAAQAPPDGPAADAIAAERYGNAMHLSEKYRNRSWDEVDHELKSGWELRDPGTPSWNAAEAAIRRGWDDASPEIDEDSYYRTHWNVQYAHEAGRNREHAPASVSADKARDGFQYRMRHWTAVATDQRASWASRHVGELPPWERFKDAVLHGWGRINLGNDNREDGRP